MMKKIFYSLSIVLLVLIFAISGHSQVTLGAKVGVNMYTFNQSLEDEDDEVSLNLRPGFLIGLVANIPLQDNLSLRSGITFITKGTNIDLEEVYEEISDITVEGKSYLGFSYLEIPIHLDFKMNNFHLIAGPYIGLGLGGKAVSDFTVTGAGTDLTVDNELTFNPAFGEVDPDTFGDNEDAFNALDIGLNLGVGYQTGPVLISVEYSYGFGNITPKYKDTEDTDDKLTNTGINVAATYLF